MCGIFGVWNLHKQPVELGALLNSLNSIRHRGPDDEGYLLINSNSNEVASCLGPESAAHVQLPRIENVFNPQFDLAFGFRRLSILDLSPAGHQPMSNADGSLWIVFNGEIYNYIELRGELQALGYVFRTQTDTEVILNAYDAWGEGCLDRLNGMWGFALFDKRKKRLFCARDRFGIKPFYFFFDRECFVFASEIKAVLQYSNIERKPNDAIVYDYLNYGLLDHSAETFFTDIHQLPAAHYLVLEDLNIHIKRYWNINPDNKLGFGSGAQADAKYIRQFYELFEDSVRLHLRSDVAIGSCLSGGLDSSSIVCMANNLLFSEHSVPTDLIGEKQKTFSSCFEDLRFDEREHIEKVLSATSAERNYTFPNPQDLLSDLPDLVWHQEEPFGSTSIYAQWCVMKIASQRGVRVLLDGQGADELLAGYHPYFDSYWGTLLSRGRFQVLMKEWSAYKNIYQVSPAYLIQHTLFSIAPAFFQRQVRAKRGAIGLQADFVSKFWKRYPDEHIEYIGDPFSKRLYQALTRSTLPGLLHYEDRNSMAHSIEARVPFLDYRLVEFAFSLPANQKINNGYTKNILRDSMKGSLPEAIRTRADKMGFVTPEKIWLSLDLKDWVDGVINSAAFRSNPYLNATEIGQLLVEHRAQKRDLGFMIWRWISLQLWLDRFINSPS
jgi:asparagine synthase (glutamine-hydrolysing)